MQRGTHSEGDFSFRHLALTKPDGKRGIGVPARTAPALPLRSGRGIDHFADFRHFGGGKST